MTVLAEIIVSALIVISGVFGLVGSYGLIKLPDTMRRLHAPTKATTVGVSGVLIASTLYFGAFKDTVSFHELMIAIFLFLTASVTANFIAKAYLHRHVGPAELPETGSDFGWSVYDDPPQDKTKAGTNGTGGVE